MEILTEIKKVIIFFDLFDYPLTIFEIWHYLDKRIGFAEIEEFLTADQRVIEEKNGFYFLFGRENILKIRANRYNYSCRKRKKAEQFIRNFKCLPFIKVIALANSIGAHNLRDGSDIDFFIITAPRRIWLTRFIVAGAAKILNRRPTSKNKRDKICLSFYLTTDNLNFDNLKLADSDPYLYYWLRTLVLLYNKNNSYETFLAANSLGRNPSLIKVCSNETTRKNFFFDFLENFLKKIQLKIMSPALKQAMNNSAGVIVNDQVLKLYQSDNRHAYAEKYGNKLRQVLAKNN